MAAPAAANKPAQDHSALHSHPAQAPAPLNTTHSTLMRGERAGSHSWLLSAAAGALRVALLHAACCTAAAPARTAAAAAAGLRRSLARSDRPTGHGGTPSIASGVPEGEQRHLKRGSELALAGLLRQRLAIVPIHHRGLDRQQRGREGEAAQPHRGTFLFWGCRVLERSCAARSVIQSKSSRPGSPPRWATCLSRPVVARWRQLPRAALCDATSCPDL